MRQAVLASELWKPWDKVQHWVPYLLPLGTVKATLVIGFEGFSEEGFLDTLDV